ncbi:hypothetical protein [Micromonospora echinofusca]|uniref:Phosphotransferase enzyme family protein n=1 Tax=Micromonospora echinofusca TaxID=47858 RepID=A0ABS3VJX3_MICEH|nr:hypothetical protein [Micromonospora echinofusca]MBO4204809.1 hypothetical protein [Micromonospora echinofusca]
MTAAPTLHRFATSLLAISVRRTPDGYLWVREPGPSYRPPTPVPDGLLDRVGRLHPAIRTPATDGRAFHYPTAGPFSAAMLLSALRADPVRVPTDPVRVPTDHTEPDNPSRVAPARPLRATAGPDRRALLADGLRAAGAALAALHRHPLPAQVVDEHPGPARLGRWLAGNPDPATPVGRLRAEAYPRLGAARWARLDAALRALTAVAGGDRPALLHGAASLSVIVPQSRGRSVLLTGEAFARGPWWLDLGWLVAELHEVRAAAAVGLPAAPDGDLDDLHRALVEGYGRPVDPDVVAVLAAARVLTHAHDFAAYVGWHDQLLDYLDITADLVDRLPGGA